MNHYRALNKELIEQLQTMRINTKLYCDEILLLKAELAQQREREVYLRKLCYNWAVENFLQIVQIVQPEADILPLLKEHVQPPERVSTVSSVENGVSMNRRFSEESIAAGRRISLLASELRRSNSLLNIRKSVRSTSPIQINNEEQEETEDEFDCEEREVQTFDQQPQEFVGNQPVLRQIENFVLPNIIHEESEIENVDQDGEDHDLSVQSVDESEDVLTLLDITNTRSNVRDIQNISSDSLKNITKKTNSKNGSKQLRSKKPQEIGQENSTVNTTSKTFFSNTEQTVGRRRYRTRLTDNSVQSMDEETLAELRSHLSTKNDAVVNKSIPIIQECNKTCRNITADSSFTISNDRSFTDAITSTPNDTRNSLRKPTTPSRTNLSISVRPSRQCKPKELAEPQLRTKLRNENAFKTKTRSKSKNKKQKK